MSEIPLTKFEQSSIEKKGNSSKIIGLLGIVIMAIACVAFALFDKIEYLLISFSILMFMLFTHYFSQKNFNTENTKFVGDLTVIKKNIIHDSDDEDFYEILLKSAVIPRIYVKPDFWNCLNEGDFFYIEITKKLSHLLIILYSEQDVKSKLDFRKNIEVIDRLYSTPTSVPKIAPNPPSIFTTL